MNIIIIEDEQLTADVLQDILLDISPDNKVVAILNSVEEAVTFFKKHQTIDLIFSNIQLGDGLSFEIFEGKVTPAPIIFCTTYDEYALKAFETNGFHYILKPFDALKIREALDKFNFFKESFSPNNFAHNYQKLASILQLNKSADVSSVLVNKKDRIIPLKFNDIALIYIEVGITYVLTFSGEKYSIEKTLNELQDICPNYFYRVNRQFIINRDAIKEIGESLSRRAIIHLSFPFHEEVTVSKEKKTQFLNWVEEH